ncbi:MAG: hypothetical protein FD188_3411 [Ignavibacteria bacterium]|nr:MAG: hypothetical protein FD188_3411 [Ignavibacteria bacterium]
MYYTLIIIEIEFRIVLLFLPDFSRVREIKSVEEKKESTILIGIAEYSIGPVISLLIIYLIMQIQ